MADAAQGRVDYLQRNLPWAKSDQPESWYTNLPHHEEMGFRDWVTQNKVPFDPNEHMPDYDMRGYWQKTGGKDWKEGSHFPDTWKTPLHQSFSRESKYANDKAPQWKGDTLVTPEGIVVYQEPTKLGPTDEAMFNTDFQMMRQAHPKLDLPVDPDEGETDFRKLWMAIEQSDPLHHQQRGMPANMENPSFGLLQHIPAESLQQLLEQYKRAK